MGDTNLFSHEEYALALKQFIEDIFDNFDGIADTYIIPGIIDYCGKLKAAQESIGTVHCISISFMNTGLYFNRPYFQIDAYGEDWRLYLRSLYTDVVSCDWLLPYWQKFKTSLASLAATHEVKKDQTDLQIEQAAWSGIGPAISMVASLLKYRVNAVENSPEYKQLQKYLPFRLEIGEYLDWKLPLIVQSDAVDIFISFGTNYAYYTFKKKVYKAKAFTKLNLTHAIFMDCDFDNSAFSGCTLNDCVFKNCTFGSVRFDDCLLPGCSFEHCRLSQTAFVGCIGSTVEMEPTKIVDYYRPFHIRDSSCHQVSFEDCGLAYCGIVNCTTTYVSVENCRTDSSLFEAFQT